MNEDKFTKKANVYDKARPSYPIDAIKRIIKDLPKNAVLADIGCGTGKLTEMLLNAGFLVYGIEPNYEMLELAKKNLSGIKAFIPINATAENTTLPNSIADIICVAQALHWFDIEKFKAECNRILKPSGKVFVIYNKFVGETAELYGDFLSIHCNKFKGFAGGDSVNKVEQFFDANYELQIFDSEISYNSQRFVERALSSSYTPKQGEQDYDKFINALNAFFIANQKNDRLIFQNRTSVFSKK